jgi:hypothetical protein
MQEGNNWLQRDKYVEQARVSVPEFSQLRAEPAKDVPVRQAA